MPGYGILPADQGSGLLPWARGRAPADRLARLLVRDRAPRRPAARHAGLGGLAGRPALVLQRRRSRKARNLDAEPRCTLTTDDARDPVVVEGVAERVVEPPAIRAFLAR